MWTFCGAQHGNGRAARHRGKGYSRTSSSHKGDRAAGWAESSACQSDWCQCPAGRWTRWWASNRCRKLPPLSSRGERSCAYACAGPLPGSGCGGQVRRSSAAWLRCTGRRCRALIEAVRRWSAGCCRRKPAALAPDPSRTPHRWRSLRFWTPHGRCEQQPEPPERRTGARSQIEGKCRPRQRCASSVGVL